MKFRFPLYAKVLVWFFLNLMLLGAVFYGFFRFQFHAGLGSLLAGQAEERLEALGSVIEAELREKPPAAWDAVLERYNSAYQGVEFFLFRPNGMQIAGALVELPAQVRGRFPGLRLPFAAALGGESEARSGRQRGKWAISPWIKIEQPSRRAHPKFMVRTESPIRYWIGIRLAGKGTPGLGEQPAILFAVASTLSGGGLFFDAGPWMKVGFAAVSLSILFWLPLVRGMTRSVSQITRATEQVAEGDFNIRVDTARRDELGRLAQAINIMAERLSGFVTGQKRFLGDAAHELCSPLARIEVALGILEARAEAALQPRIADVREEAREMAGLVNEILAFSKASLHADSIPRETVALAELVRRVAERETEGILPVQLEIPETLQVLADPGLLARAVANLLRNVVRHADSVDGVGPVTVRAGTRGAQVLLTVTDAGPGVPEEALAQLFDPFFRLDVSRSRETGGFGLGLAIVKTCVQACGGSVTARNVQPSGLQVELTLESAMA